MSVERRVLKSISEFSIFKYLLFFNLLFFLLTVIVVLITRLATGLGLSFSEINIENILNVFSLGNLAISGFLGEGGTVSIIVLIISGLVASVLLAAVGMVMTWIANVVLKISGGIELRFLPRKRGEVRVKKSE